MSRLLLASILCCTVAIGATAYTMLSARTDGTPWTTPRSPGPIAPAPSQPDDEDRAALRTARRTFSAGELDALVARLRTAVAAGQNDVARWRLYAEALAERIALRCHLRGVAIATPIYSTLPSEVAADIDAGLVAVARARELGDDGAEVYRLEAELLSQRITGLASALQWNGKIQDALAKAAERGNHDPRLQVALGLRRLLAPALLGNDPARALEHFEFAANASPDDERPAVFAAMANLLQKKRQETIRWLENAVQRNPNNIFAKVVLRRVKRGEEDPFGRDVTASEASSVK